MSTLLPMLQSTAYHSYTYAYPHKTAYRTFAEPLPLSKLWQEENRDAAFLYMHIPFCEMRCGFCNLFTTVNPAGDFVDNFLSTLRNEATQVSEQIGPINIARMALGGGTPTFLSAHQLEELFSIAYHFFNVQPNSIPTSVETSPLTATPDRLQVLQAHGVDRISIGVQSFLEDEVHSIGRSQKSKTVHQALEHIRASNIATLNIDLIYGLPGQTLESWLESLRIALTYQPEELYLYPLYVRPLTGLDRLHERRNQANTAEDTRLSYYRAARDLLVSSGYTQVSMRMFQAPHAPAQTGPVYCMQDDGMIGLGCGARSYTRTHHYSNEYAVSSKGVRAILANYVATPTQDFGYARYGFELNAEEQRRRYVLKSLLEEGELHLSTYQQRFNQHVLHDLPQLQELFEHRLIEQQEQIIRLTNAGLEYSDAIGPWLYSTTVQTLMEGYTLR